MNEQEELRAGLVEARRRAAERVAKREDGLRTLTRARRSASDDDEHDPEGETLSAQWSLRAGLLADARETLRQADAALERLGRGEYGNCRVCGGPIPPAQLEVRPFRESCVACG
ncbi:molecular chaperone DnaK [Leucobacter allii]|uniref:TraR/DksA family transcriptional regulator n=1 Tax=Leucobacter allii TaxID=2932247 RepID=UPI001FD41027|nr:TraR/DksA C4-type zinc finger protein [Leucobacter allii]UOR00408.1 molecular chaperone DnaK [Leucobacter allii]